ncbi:hypothetical protein KSF_106250 [Reticulibacter mediterranei]|uniref:N-acetyltransferase domain-containing protein n=1 Tax=Reticulibacter mediterranei TaxID=2778369 RepID=A0A8J3NAN8_9CHLR|nr:GNAT family N-acetyltransferase [Reticulibacter mediterranei]GHP00578.1 hypothetical protein KSF_106250 [Reticulibacter mediterranei]
MASSHSPYTVSGLSASFEEVIAFIQAQEARLVARDPRLQAVRPSHKVRAALMLQPSERHASSLAVFDAQKQLRGYVAPDIWQLPKDSLLHAFLTERNGIAQSLTLPNPADRDVRDVTSMVLSALSASWQRAGSTGDLIRWPSHDTDWLEPILLEHGFLLDSICALRPLSAPSLAPRVAHRTAQIREAHPSDEEALLNLFEEELRVHARCIPFARVSLAAIHGFRRRLARLWDGETLEEGAPLVLIAERGQNIVGMAECLLCHVSPDEEPGFTPPGHYGCLDNVCVAESARGQGIGTLLTQAALAAFEPLPDLKGYILWYSPGNVLAAHFWPHAGFEPLWTTFQRLPHMREALHL